MLFYDWYMEIQILNLSLSISNVGRHIPKLCEKSK